MNAAQLPPTGFIRIKQVLELIPVSKSTIWSWCKEGRFPAPVKLTEGCTVWRVEDVRKYIEQAV